MRRASFDPVVDAYDQARPGYPEALFETLEAATRPLPGAEVLEGGAGRSVGRRRRRRLVRAVPVAPRGVL